MTPPSDPTVTPLVVGDVVALTLLPSTGTVPGARHLAAHAARYPARKGYQYCSNTACPVALWLRSLGGERVHVLPNSWRAMFAGAVHSGTIDGRLRRALAVGDQTWGALRERLDAIVADDEWRIAMLERLATVPTAEDMR